MYFRQVTIRQVSSLLGPFFQKNWDLSTFATRSLISQISSTGPYMGGPYITILRVHNETLP